ncbi:hypothetical protein DFH06DRAFT_171338 [Mycena polygramma]|nr:hypothetical protein DFH06DRAFT_171338 [Mycena polygramma]
MTVAVLVHTRLPTRSLGFPAPLSPSLSPWIFPPPFTLCHASPALSLTHHAPHLVPSGLPSPSYPSISHARSLDDKLPSTPGGIIDGVYVPGSDAKVDRSLAMWCLPRRLSPRMAGCINSASLLKLSAQSFIWRGSSRLGVDNIFDLTSRWLIESIDAAG